MVLFLFLLVCNVPDPPSVVGLPPLVVACFLAYHFVVADHVMSRSACVFYSLVLAFSVGSDL